ncbi:MAG TPA: hypothetical protein VF322_16085 [Gammaproteobacteria bacterium]
MMGSEHAENPTMSNEHRYLRAEEVFGCRLAQIPRAVRDAFDGAFVDPQRIVELYGPWADPRSGGIFGKNLVGSLGVSRQTLWNDRQRPAAERRYAFVVCGPAGPASCVHSLAPFMAAIAPAQRSAHAAKAAIARWSREGVSVTQADDLAADVEP